MHPYNLRSAGPQDEGQIKSLVRSARLNPSGLKWTRFVVATTPQGKVLACGQIKPHRDGSHELSSLVVQPGHRGQGLARAIIEYLLAEYNGELYLMCRSSLGPFYRKFGFQTLTFTEMPLYFQRISRLTSVIELLRKEGETLMVMKRET
jgi:N-acetylglutamate synthase-like GNAT family acetyltransferase